MWLDIWFYISGLGLLAALFLLIYFIAAYRKAGSCPAAKESAPAQEHISAATHKISLASKDKNKPAVQELSKAAVFLKNVHDDILLFNKRIHNLERLVVEKNSIHEKQICEVINSLRVIMGKIEGLEPQIQQDFQPYLQSLASAMESLKLSAGYASEQPPSLLEKSMTRGPAEAGQPAEQQSVEIAPAEEAAPAEAVRESVPENPPVQEDPAELAQPPVNDPLSGNSKNVYPV